MTTTPGTLCPMDGSETRDEGLGGDLRVCNTCQEILSPPELVVEATQETRDAYRTRWYPAQAARDKYLAMVERGQVVTLDDQYGQPKSFFLSVVEGALVVTYVERPDEVAATLTLRDGRLGITF